MSWKTFHNRGETLRDVVTTANDRRDGVLPVSVPGVSEHFRDELDLIGALQLKWHARLSGNIERALVLEPMDLESAVASAWRTTAEQMPGVRMIIDRFVEDPTGPAMAAAMSRSREHELARLATAAGLASGPDHAAVEAGSRVERKARLALGFSLAAPSAETSVETPARTPVETRVADPVTEEIVVERPDVSFVDRIKAVIAA